MPLGAFRLNSLGKFTIQAGRTAKTTTVFGGTFISTSQSKFGGASASFDGTSDGLTANYPNGQTDVWMSGNYTYECWIYITNRTNYRIVFVQGGQATGNQPGLYINSSGKIVVLIGSATAFTGTTSTINTNTWYHIALVRNNGTIKAYVNGTADAGSYSNSGTISGSTDIHIGRYPGDSATMFGYIDEFRISNTARYTANFTSPTVAFTNDTNTLLLLHLNGSNGSTVFTDDNS